MILDFLDQPIGGSKYFKWREALYLHEWDILVFPESPTIYLNIIDSAQTMDKIREFFNRSVTINSWYRPPRYNKQIGGAVNSSHRFGKAVDFIVQDFSPNQVRDNLVGKLVELDIRMENLPDSSWTHIDRNTTPNMPLEARNFKP